MSQAVASVPVGERSPTGWLLVGGIVLAALTEAIASTTLSVGRTDIIGDIHATPDEFAWLDVSYTAVKLIAFAFTPWLLTRIPSRACLFAATLAMGAACGGAALATSLEALIVLRLAQGFAGGLLLVSSQTILFQNYPLSSQPVLQALFAIGAVVAPATLAPALQGWLIDTHAWTWIFFSILPIALAAAGLVVLGDNVPAVTGKRRPFDAAGFALFAVAVFSATYVLSQGSRWNWFESGRILWAGLLASVTFVLFVVRQRLAGERALFDLTVFRTDDFTFAFAVSFVAGAALFGSAFLIPAFASSILGFTPTDAGLLLLPSGALFVAALLFAAVLIQKRGAPPIATVPAGILLIMTAMWMLSFSTLESGPQDMMTAILLRGLGLGFLFLSITLIAFGQLPPHNVASGIAIFNIGRQLGGLVGVAGLQTLIDHQIAANHAVIAATATPGVSAASERLGSITAVLIARGMDATAAAKAATGMLGRAISQQASVIAFDTAFGAIALLFIAAAPVLIAIKIGLARTAKARSGQNI